MESLRKAGLIYKQRRKYYWCASLHCKTGTVVRLSRTFGLSVQMTRKQKATGSFRESSLLGALPQDRVLMRSIPSRSGKPEGEVLDILEQASARLTGIIVYEDGKPFLLPDTMSKTPIRLLPNREVSYQVTRQSFSGVLFPVALAMPNTRRKLSIPSEMQTVQQSVHRHN